MNSMADGEREKFEAWLKDRPHMGFAGYAWEAWQAALAARQPVGQEPVGYANIHQLNNPRNDGVVLRRKDDDGFFTEPLYRRPPAQAVDLGRFRPMVVEYKRSYDGVGHDEEMRECDELLALIDRKAVAQEAAPFRFISEAERAPKRSDMRDRGSVGYQHKPNTTDEGAKG